MKRISLRIAGYAAAIAILVGSTYWFTMQHASKEWPTEMLSLHVPAGQRLQLTLQDGTSVWLNARTTITYPSHFPSSERRVSIDGEALFDVAKENSRPFIVSSRGVEMEVLGTEFNLYSYPEAEYIRTSLLEGSLSVYRTQEKRKNIILEPNQQVTIKGRQMLVDKIPDPAYFLWTEGVYSFHNEPLINILRKLELYYDVKIEVKDPSIYTWEYTGKFRQRDGIDEILRIINKIHKFTIEKDEENNKIILS
ncbi:FecR domain-containing protein [Parabacteroides sp. OttesenSCG-928-K15]|nr:FecR domain-containing protein [Parabacteroides sp. OttesenSCG-928-K15]